jgi:hypothetical protein
VTATKGRRFSPFLLDAINFLLADVSGTLGPYLNVFLVPNSIGACLKSGW